MARMTYRVNCNLHPDGATRRPTEGACPPFSKSSGVYFIRQTQVNFLCCDGEYHLHLHLGILHHSVQNTSQPCQALTILRRLLTRAGSKGVEKRQRSFLLIMLIPLSPSRKKRRFSGVLICVSCLYCSAHISFSNSTSLH